MRGRAYRPASASLQSRVIRLLEANEAAGVLLDQYLVPVRQFIASIPDRVRGTGQGFSSAVVGDAAIDKLQADVVCNFRHAIESLPWDSIIDPRTGEELLDDEIIPGHMGNAFDSIEYAVGCVEEDYIELSPRDLMLLYALDQLREGAYCVFGPL